MTLSPDEWVGPYRIVDTLGEGGMGVVYLADQVEPVRRQVALKLLRSGAASAQVLARFDAERQALAVMDHPSIAKVFDAGVTDDGRPYFAMEFVGGTSLTEYCDQHRLSLRERVRLFVDVCRAVQHAHQKGVIHRDLKPSNVLVSDVDGRPLPRIIDFGIAKAVRAEEFDGTRLTRDDQVIGTPAYMSPEQIEGSADVDTRSDIYALGVLLFELLAGALPYEAKSYRGWAAVAAQLHREPPTPAQRLVALDDTQETVARLRSTTVAALRRELDGDLGWIVSRAMEKNRDERYETVNAMALDLERHLVHEPVRARGSTTAYKLRKFTRRNRLAVAFGATALVGLVAFSVVTSIQAERIARARDEADVRRDQAEGLINFMLSDLREKLASIGRLEILDDVGQQATAYFRSIPEAQFTDAELASRSQALYQIGSVRLDQGDSRAAGEAFEESLRLARALSERAPDDPDRLFGLSQSYFYVGYAAWMAGDFDAAETDFMGYLDAAERLAGLKPENPDYRLEVGFAHGNLGSVQEARGDLTGAAGSYERTLETLRILVERDPTNINWLGELAETENKAAVVRRKLGDYQGALAGHSEELRLKDQILELAPEHAYWRYRRAMASGFLAGIYSELGRLDESLARHRIHISVLDSLVAYDETNRDWDHSLARARLGEAETFFDLGWTSEALGSLDSAQAALERLVDLDSTVYPWRLDLSAALALRARLQLAAGQSRAALASADAALSALGEPGADATTVVLVKASGHVVRGAALAARSDSTGAQVEWTAALALLQPLAGGPEQHEVRPLLTEVLLSLGRVDDARVEWEALVRVGYANPTLARIVERVGAR